MPTNTTDDATNEPTGGNEGENPGGAATGTDHPDGSQSSLSPDEAIIAFVVSSLIPKFQEQASSTPINGGPQVTAVQLTKGTE
ncbi:hypothetical protein PGTUg99_001127 [Puccinia graminis f. sp. tritici]|uniref:Uncharacterized protein n=1 Tax=Puccinia graminis f. sp. tritici TaxID=56615 RepID=A0A5B0RBY3_PUCGR|nr:hypothetical protein PGTUg99_001127 [Puccinia graminis f. sp. tritici]